MLTLAQRDRRTAQVLRLFAQSQGAVAGALAGELLVMLGWAWTAPCLPVALLLAVLAGGGLGGWWADRRHQRTVRAAR